MRKIYSFAVNDYSPLATPTDALIIQGADNVLSQVLRITAMAEGATVAGSMAANLIRRSTKFTTQGSAVFTPLLGGTFDTRQDAQAQTIVQTVGTANITSLGASAGFLGTKVFSMPVGGSGSVEWEYRWIDEYAPRLTNSSDFIMLNFNGDALPAGTIKMYFEVLIEESGLR